MKLRTFIIGLLMLCFQQVQQAQAVQFQFDACQIQQVDLTQVQTQKCQIQLTGCMAQVVTQTLPTGQVQQQFVTFQVQDEYHCIQAGETQVTMQYQQSRPQQFTTTQNFNCRGTLSLQIQSPTQDNRQYFQGKQINMIQFRQGARQWDFLLTTDQSEQLTRYLQQTQTQTIAQQAQR